jgi:NitT/TauT family transport system substrate-binding protein
MDPRRIQRGWAAVRRQFLYALVALGAALAAAPALAQKPDDPPVIRLQLNWMNQAQFAGFYVADAMGFYQREGITVEFIAGGPPFPGGPTQDPLLTLELGGADLAVAWMSNAFAARSNELDIVNIGQIFRQAGTSLVCRRAAGIHRPADLKGKRVGIWNIGDQVNLGYWLRQHKLTLDDVKLSTQRPDAADLIAGAADCVTAMNYNEYWTLLRSFKPNDLFIVRFGEEDSAFLEDGIYAKASAVADPEMRARFARFLRATSAGWRYARDNPEVAIAVTLYRTPGSDPSHQRRMLETVLSLAEPSRDFGLLNLDDFHRSVDILALGNAPAEATARLGWTHEVWREANLGNAPLSLTPAIKHYLVRIVDSPWFYIIGLLGTAASMVGAFMRAVQRRYDLWGAFMLTLLAIGGGTLRDLLVGGDRLPLFMFKDPVYFMMILIILAAGIGITRSLPETALDSRRFTLTLETFDAVGVATFTVLGTKVAIIAGLAWYWAPFCAALSCAGGGMLRDIVTGREPRTFQGEPYEEIAVVGSLALFFMLWFASSHEHSAWMVTGAIALTMVGVFVTRMTVVLLGWRSYRLGSAVAPAPA